MICPCKICLTISFCRERYTMVNKDGKKGISLNIVDCPYIANYFQVVSQIDYIEKQQTGVFKEKIIKLYGVFGDSYDPM